MFEQLLLSEEKLMKLQKIQQVEPVTLSTPRRINAMEKVINCFQRRPEAAVRLICFPWAGGGSMHYARWGALLGSSVEVLSVRLAGRESRARERFPESMEEVVEEVVGALLPQLADKPFALFGHSFGALSSFAVAQALKKLHNLEPLHIFLSGASAPHSEVRMRAEKRSTLSDECFLHWLRSVGGTPPELLADPEVLRLFLPALKADLHVVESFRWDKPERPPLSCALSCLDGKDDAPHDLQAWKDITTGDFTVRMFEGSHFYLKDPENEKAILDYITRQLETSQMDYL